MQLLNSEQIRDLFGQESALIGSVDGVPLYRAVELFGQEAVQSARDPDKGGTNFNVVSIGDFYVYYLTYRGFREAARYANLLAIRESGRA